MKKALQISIAQTLFTIEEDAYAKLDAYLGSIRSHFEQTEGGADIISDIEGRIAEQFNETGARIITIQEVEKVIATMGKVEDFDDKSDTASTTETPKANKKLYRDPSTRIIAGVCAGMAAYVGTDPLWVRIAFVLLTLLTHGLGIIVYIILAIMIPKATTASQKLEMEGSPVTLDTISKNVKDKADEIRSKHGSKIMHILSLPFAILKKVVDFLTKYIVPILRVAVGVILAAASIAGMIALSVIAPLALMNGSAYVGFDITSVISAELFYFAIASAYITLLIPCVFVFMLATSIIKKKFVVHSGVGLSFLVIWCLALACAIVSGINIGQKVSHDPFVQALFEEKTIEQPLPLNIREVRASNGIRVIYMQSDQPSLSITGRRDVLETVSASTSGQTLNIDRTEVVQSCLFCGHGDAEILVSLPTLKAVTVANDSSFYADAWTIPSDISLTAVRGSYASANIDVTEIEAVAKQGSHIRLTGKAKKANLTDVQGSYISAEELQK